jgi:hypothetical protein
VEVTVKSVGIASATGVPSPPLLQPAKHEMLNKMLTKNLIQYFILL